MGWGDRGFDLGALGLGMPGTMGIGTMIELADQFDRAFEGVEVAIAVIADVHPAATDRTVAIEDVELPRREIGIRRPSVGHRADLQVLMKPLADKSGQEVTRESCPFLATCRAVVFFSTSRETARTPRF